MGPHNKRSEKENAGQRSFEERLLILHNDEINTFDHVISTLQDICEHDDIQAEQCALLTHFKGSCEIKKGALYELEELRYLLAEKSLCVTID
jgi:ATP-dependent Clp protease adaptor protein ClpS